MKVIAILGRNGSGKTLYVDKMRKEMAGDQVRYIAFRDSYGVATDQTYYLQLRWNQHDIDAETPTNISSPSQAESYASSSWPRRCWPNRKR